MSAPITSLTQIRRFNSGGQTAQPNKSTVRCQKCLLHGHYSYECTGDKAFATRPSRSQLLKKSLLKKAKGVEEEEEAEEKEDRVGLANRILDKKNKDRKRAKKKMSKNAQLIPGVATLSRSAAYKAKGLFNRKKAAGVAAPAKPTTVVKKIGGAKNGAQRTVSVAKTSKFYAAEDAPVNRLSRKVNRPATTRASITPGTILILVAGRFAGKRVVYLQTLPSGLLLVTGPFKINGVPLRRVNQAYAIATSAKVDVSSVVIPASISDAAFKATREAKAKATEAALFDISAKRGVSDEKIAAQKAVDAAILAEVKKQPLLKAYLNASFSLTKGQAPHAMKF
ncbi:hypothetical protein HDU98_006418 [Podochytrium sp. JEL0797]|nr:hypothetical protein HDU98_006418 [Podochytrium sp. JEL0797]